MVDYLRRCALEPDQPRPSIETLLHAFVGAAHVDHTHPDAVIALTSSPDGRLARRGGVRRRGGLARLPAPGLRHVEADRRAPRRASVRPRRPARAPRPRHVGQDVRGGLQEHHRVRHESCRGGRAGPEPAGSVSAVRASAELGESECLALLAQTLPVLRGSLLADADGVVLEVDRSPAALAFASSARAPEVSQVGAPCPDHLINTKHRPLVVAFRPGDRRRRRPRRRLPTRSRRVRRVVSRVLRGARRRRDAPVPDRSRSARGSP